MPVQTSARNLKCWFVVPETLDERRSSDEEMVSDLSSIKGPRPVTRAPMEDFKLWQLHMFLLSLQQQCCTCKETVRL